MFPLLLILFFNKTLLSIILNVTHVRGAFVIFICSSLILTLFLFIVILSTKALFRIISNTICFSASQLKSSNLPYGSFRAWNWIAGPRILLRLKEKAGIDSVVEVYFKFQPNCSSTPYSNKFQLKLVLRFWSSTTNTRKNKKNQFLSLT